MVRVDRQEGWVDTYRRQLAVLIDGLLRCLAPRRKWSWWWPSLYDDRLCCLLCFA